MAVEAFLPSREELAAWLILLRAPGVGPITYRKVLQHFGTPQAVIGASRRALQETGILRAKAVDYLVAARLCDVAEDLNWAAATDHHILTLADAAYPPCVLQIPDPPPVLFVVGDVNCLQSPQLAVVGSRHPSRAGQEHARAFAADLARAGLTIVSGLAYGVDALAHEGALAGGGRTIAVMATGPDRLYPAAHKALAARIRAHGALVTEFPPGTPPLAEHFPRRNRIISGLARGTLVVEAAVQSGSLITARLAAEQGREVFAIPGSIHNPLARGCHKLIREGAKLVEQSADILEELGMLKAASENSAEHLPEHVSFDPKALKLLEFVEEDPIPIDALVEGCGLTAEEVSSMLMVLELHGVVAAQMGGYVRVGAARGAHNK